MKLAHPIFPRSYFLDTCTSHSDLTYGLYDVFKNRIAALEEVRLSMLSQAAARVIILSPHKSSCLSESIHFAHVLKSYLYGGVSCYNCSSLNRKNRIKINRLF